MKIRWTVLISFCLGISVAGFARAVADPVNPPQESTTESVFQQELINIQKAFLDALDKGNSEYLKSTVADDFMVVGTNGDTSGKAELVRYVQPQERPGPKPFFYDFHVVRLDADCAVVTYNAVFHGAPLDRYQHLSDAWVKQDGQWKLKFEQATINLWSAHDLD